MTSSTAILATALATALHSSNALSASSSSMWQILQTNNNDPFHTIFAPTGSRGEYMDGYSKADMIERCRDDYNWKFSEMEQVEQERVEMMSHLYNDCPSLWKHVGMVAFAEHYLMNDDDDDDENENDDGSNHSQAYETFMKQKKLQPPNQPIFGGVVWNTWQQDDRLPSLYTKNNIDYVRLHCNFGNVIDGGAQQLIPENNHLFGKLARAAKECQMNEMVPLILLQVPWRENDADEYFDQVVQGLATELHRTGVDCQRLILETRPPIGISAQEEEDGMSSTKRQELGYRIGQNMFQSIHKAFQDTTIVGFCVAGGSTKGQYPTAMQDDTQNAVRQGIRSCALDKWGYELCFWEMGAKLMLQPEVGRLWGNGGREEACELFCANARGMAEEIQQVM